MHPASSPLTWLLAVLFLAGIDAAITRTGVLWGPTAFENRGGIRLVFPQTYQVARKIYHPERHAAVRIALLGNSRVVLAVKEKRLERALLGQRPDLDADVSNLGIFGSFMADTEMLARHLGALDPSAVVLAVGAPDLIREPTHPGGEGPMQLLRIGLRDGSIGDASLGERLDRLARTVWPLYRFKEFAREAILDRVLGRVDPGPRPEEFESRLALFRQLYGERADAVHAAFRDWQAGGGLDAYVRYLETASPEHLARGVARAKSREPITRETPSVLVFDALVADLARAGRPVLVLLMPENPILSEDRAGRFHRADVADEAARLVGEIASSHGVPVVDARRWLPAECFLDFDHPIWDLDSFERSLAAEILHVLDGYEHLKIVACALFYACAIAALVVFGPSEPHVFIYQGF